MQQALIIFVRNPQEGNVKTRLAATVGAEAARHVYKKLLTHTLAVAQQVDADKFVFYADAVLENDMWRGERFFKLLQDKGGLGERMQAAFAQVFDKGYKRVVIIGSDCPQLTVVHLQETFSNLHTHDVIIGPASDGGYYLLGLKQLYAGLFIDKAWSTGTVYNDTMRTIEKLQLRHHALETLTDVDEEKDLPAAWKAEIQNLFNLT